MLQDDIRRIYYNNGLEVTENEDCKKVPERERFGAVRRSRARREGRG